MILALQRDMNGHKLISKITPFFIQLWTRSQYFHSALVVDGYILQATTQGVFKTPFVFDNSNYDYFNIPCSKEAEQRVLNYMQGEIGCEYDWKGIFLSQILPLSREDPEKWFCSELTTKLLQISEVEEVEGCVPCTMSPGDILKVLDLKILG